MKKLGLILFAFMAMSVCALAQGQGEGRQRGQRPGGMRAPNKEQMVKMMTDRQIERLKLTEKQIEQMKVLNEALVTEMMSQRPQMGNPQERQEMTPEEREKMRKEREKKMTEMQNNYVTLVKAVLTEEQFIEFEKMQKERPQGFRQGNRRGGPGGQGGGPRGNRGGFGGGNQ